MRKSLDDSTVSVFARSLSEHDIDLRDGAKFNMTLFPTLREIYLNIVAQH